MGKPLKEFHSDGAGEFLSDELKEFFKKEGTRMTTTMPHTPQHNGRAERKGRTIFEAVRSMLHYAKAPAILWGEAAITSVETRNMASVKSGSKLTPNQLWYKKSGMKQSVKHMRTWGCDAWVHIPDAYRTKLEAKSAKCIFLGYDESGIGYRFYNVEKGTVVRSKDATFDERSFTQCALLKQLLLGMVDENPVRMETPEEFDIALNNIMNESNLKVAQILSEATQQPSVPVQGDDDDDDGEDNAVAVPVKGVSEAIRAEPPPVDVDVPTVVPSNAEVQGVQSDQAQQPSMKVNNDIKLDDFAEYNVEQVSDADSEYQPDSDECDSDDEVGSNAVETKVEPRRSTRERKRTHFHQMFEWGDVACMLAALVAKSEAGMKAAARRGLGLPDPTTVKEALQAPDADHWEESTEDEHRSMMKNNVMVEVDRLPHGMKAIPTKYVFKRKLDLNGLIARRKTRMVAQGFRQQYGVDYNETFAPTLHGASLRILLATVTALDYDLTQMDVETAYAFLNATLKEDVYITLPKGTKWSTRQDGKPRIFKLNKALYGLKQAPLEWNEEFNHTLVNKCGFKRLTTEACLYVKTSKTGRPMYIAVFVDDTLNACHVQDRKEMEDIKNTIKHTYTVKDLGEASHILGMRITRDRVKRTMKLDQQMYVNKLLEKCGMMNCVPVSTPEQAGVHLTKAGCKSSDTNDCNGTSSNLKKKFGFMEDEEDVMSSSEKMKERYGSLVGSLLYAAICTRPDIQHAVSQLGKYVSNPQPAHWYACKRVLRYLKKTSDVGLTFKLNPHSDNIVLGPVYADANWAGDLDDRKSTTGVVMKINGCAVSWMSKKQRTVAQSTAEAEYIAMSMAVKEIMWMRQLLKEMMLEQKDGTVLYCDNNSAIITAQHETQHSRMKHIDISYHAVREQVINKNVNIKWIPTLQQQADILTKGLGKHLFEPLRTKVTGSSGIDTQWNLAPNTNGEVDEE